MWFCSVSAASFLSDFLKFDPGFRRPRYAVLHQARGEVAQCWLRGPPEACNQATGQLWGVQRQTARGLHVDAASPGLAVSFTVSVAHTEGDISSSFILQTGAASGPEQKADYSLARSKFPLIIWHSVSLCAKPPTHCAIMNSSKCSFAWVMEIRSFKCSGGCR